MLVRDRMSVPALTVRADADYKCALALMQDRSLHHLPVVDAGGGLVGMAAERDLVLAARQYLQGAVEVGEVMHRGVVTATPDMSIEIAAGLMAAHRIGCLPVLDDGGRLAGIITEADIFQAIAAPG